MFVSDKDMKGFRVAKEANHVRLMRGEIWLGSVDTNKYFTSEPRTLADPSKKPWFVINIDWVDEDGTSRYEKIATNGEEWTYVKQSLGRTRIPFTDEVKQKVQVKIEKFWRSV